MANFTPITNGAAANAAIINAPLYELDNALTVIQALGGIVATRPWGVIGGLAQPTSSTNVPVTADITHTGKMVRGQTTITSTGAHFENIGNFSNGQGDHLFAGASSMANGDQNEVGNFCFATGQQNHATGLNAFCAGSSNVAAAENSAVLGSGANVQAGSVGSSVLGGQGSDIINASIRSGIVSGLGNRIDASQQAFIGGGAANLIQGNSNYSAIVAGSTNNMSSGSVQSVIVAGNNNLMIGTRAFIGAGYANVMSATNGFLGAGLSNQNYGEQAAVVAGSYNKINIGLANRGNYSFIGAGSANEITDAQYVFIGSGQFNKVQNNSYNAAIVGGLTNLVDSSSWSFIGAGNNNKMLSGSGNSFIGAGSLNQIGGSNAGGSAIIAGFSNTITNLNSTILGGSDNVINGYNSVIGGNDGHITHNGCFMWNSVLDSIFNSAANGEFAATAYGGFRLRSNAARTTGMDMAAGTSSWTAVSSRALKGLFAPIDGQSILDKLLSVPIQTWHFKRNGDEDFYDATNLGPTAEDWDDAFSGLLGRKTVRNMVGDTEVEVPAINEGDKLGVALAAIQGLAARVIELETKLASSGA